MPTDFIAATVELSPHTKWLYVVLASYKNNITKDAWPSYTTLQKVSGLHRNTISKGLSDLERAGWIAKEKRFQKSTIYHLRNPTNTIDSTTAALAVIQAPCGNTTNETDSGTTNGTARVTANSTVTRSNVLRSKELDQSYCADAQRDQTEWIWNQKQGRWVDKRYA